MIRRRTFLRIVATSPIAPLAANAQIEQAHKVGVLSPFAAAEAAPWHEAFRQSLRELGWIDGKNIDIEYRYAGSEGELPVLAAELARLKVEVIVTSATGTLAAKQATRTIPVVMASNADPVVMGIVSSLPRPGGNVTGLSEISSELAGKRLELLREMVPGLSRVAVLWYPGGRGLTVSWRETELPAKSLGLELQPLEARNTVELERAVASASRAHAGALMVMPSPFFASNLRRIADLAIKQRLPSIFNLREFADSGGLLSYGPNRSDEFRRAASYVDKILRGARPADLPVEQPTKFDLVINMKTAKALGLAVPRTLLLRADEVIQ